MERAEDSAHSQNINQQKEGVKKEQVKGCGSVNRPTPSSQRPAEPVTPGILQGVNFPIFRGRFWGLGVKLGVVNARFSQCRAILYGVKIGVVTVSCLQQGKQSARLSAEHIWRGCLACRLGRLRTVPTGDLRPRTPFFEILFFSSALRRVPHLKNCAAKQRIGSGKSLHPR